MLFPADNVTCDISTTWLIRSLNCRRCDSGDCSSSKQKPFTKPCRRLLIHVGAACLLWSLFLFAHGSEIIKSHFIRIVREITEGCRVCVERDNVCNCSALSEWYAAFILPILDKVQVGPMVQRNIKAVVVERLSPDQGNGTAHQILIRA